MCFFASIAISAQKEFVSTGGGEWHLPATWNTVDGGANNLNETPGINDNVTITTNTVTVGVGQTALCNNLTVNGSTNARYIQVKETGKLTINGNFITTRSQDGMRINYTNSPATKDSGTIIINGFTTSDGTTATSRRAYINKRVPSTNWHLISVGGTNSRQNELASSGSNIVVNGTKNIYAVGAYNGNNAAGSKYEYISSSSTYANSVAFAKVGYAVKVTDADVNLNLRPVIVYADASEDISDAGDGFNLVGNPHFSYLHANTAAHATDNLLAVNSGVLEEQTIWLWDAANSQFNSINLGDATALRIHPFQGFFVKAKSGGGTTQSFQYTKVMRSHDKQGDFLRSANNRFEIDLSIVSGDLTRKSSIRYIDNMTTSFDNGYDSSLFGGYASALEVYTGLVDGSSSKKLAIQSLPNEKYADMIIPVGVTAAANSEITFSTEALNLPTGIKVFLEDRLNNIFTRLDEANAKYTATVSETSTDGRFFLHTTESSLSVNDEFLNSVHIYKTDNATLRIVGLSEGNTSVKLYNVLGKQVMNSKFNATGVKELTLPKLSQGVYIVQLETETGKLNKKIVLE